MQSAWNRIFWGLLIVVLNLRIMGFDILVDFIGFVMVYTGLSDLTVVRDEFEKAKKYAFLQIFLSLQNLFVPSNDEPVPKPESIMELSMLVLGQVSIIVNIMMLYWICRVIMELAAGRGLAELREKTHFRWRVYFAVTSAVLFFVPFSLNLHEKVLIFFIPLLLLQFVSTLFILEAIYRAGREFTGASESK